MGKISMVSLILIILSTQIIEWNTFKINLDIIKGFFSKIFPVKELLKNKGR